jgi:hypothetical protein
MAKLLRAILDVDLRNLALGDAEYLTPFFDQPLVDAIIGVEDDDSDLA